MSLRELMSVYMGWAQRLIRPAPRQVGIIDGFWDNRGKRHQAEVEAHIGRIILGADLSSFLSRKIHQHGYAPKGAGTKTVRGIDWNRMDLALNAWGVHHLHLRERPADELLFTTFSRQSANLLLLGSHKSFHSGEIEAAVMRWRAQTNQWVLNGVLPERESTPAKRTHLTRHGLATSANIGGKTILSSLISSAGTSLQIGIHADRVVTALRAYDAKLDRPVLTELIRTDDLVRLKGRRWSWRMDYCDLLLVEETTPYKLLAVPGPT